jgi:pimeloyl-ACP methyl ester carboxylesterase
MSTDLMAMGTGLADQMSRYSCLTLPVGILFGTADRILDARVHGAAMADKIAHVHLEFIENGGHMMPIIAPRRTADFIRRIAARVESPEALVQCQPSTNTRDLPETTGPFSN